MLNGINFFWTIIIIISLIVAAYFKIKDYLSKSSGEKINIAKKQIKEIILKLVSDAENDYKELNKAGSIKRSQVIREIFKNYPILSKITDQSSIIEWIDIIIDESLNTLHEIILINSDEIKE